MAPPHMNETLLQLLAAAIHDTNPRGCEHRGDVWSCVVQARAILSTVPGQALSRLIR